MDIFKDNTKTIPTQSNSIIRVDMVQQDVGGRKSHLPKTEMSPMSVRHVPNATGKNS